MNDGEALFQALLANPNDDGPRLAYADWLEEHGGPEDRARAEFIRLQVQLARLPEGDSVREQLAQRESELHDRHQEHWEAAVGVAPGVTRGAA